MKELASIILALAVIYLSFAAYLYLFQRKLIYYPTPVDPGFHADEITLENEGHSLHGWVLNPGRKRALIYFGGNSEPITDRSEFFRSLFADYSVYLVNYRGYGHSEGTPSEAALFSDALAIYDHIAQQHESVSVYGRSLGSGVAVYLAVNRPLDKLILLTPYDSITEVAQGFYPWFPVRYLVRDRFDSAARAGRIDIPVFVASAEHDRVVLPRHTEALLERLVTAKVEFVQIAGAAHNDITGFVQYRKAIAGFISSNQGITANTMPRK